MAKARCRTCSWNSCAEVRTNDQLDRLRNDRAPRVQAHADDHQSGHLAAGHHNAAIPVRFWHRAELDVATDKRRTIRPVSTPGPGHDERDFVELRRGSVI